MKAFSIVVKIVIGFLVLFLFACAPVAEQEAVVDIQMQDTLIHAGSRFCVQADREINVTGFQCRLLGETMSCVIGDTVADVLVLGDFVVGDTISWLRDARMFVKGEVHLSYVDGAGKHTLVRAVSYPFKPCCMDVEAFDTFTDKETATLGFRVRACSNGSQRYVVSRKGYYDLFPVTDTVEASVLDKYYDAIPATQVYSLYLTGLNEVGQSQACFLGLLTDDTEPELRMRILCNGQTLSYSFYCGADAVTDIEVATAEIVSRTGQQTYLINAKPGELIDIQTLLPERGVYILRVTLADGRQFSETFMRR